MYRKFREGFSVWRAKRPALVVLLAILIFNILFFFLSAAIIRGLSLSGTEKMGVFEAAYYTVTMILDAGCIQFVVSDIGTAGVALSVACLAIIIIGMITFSGAVIGYVTNIISNFIENSDADTLKVYMSGHLVILNWNSRASEIINELLFSKEKQKVIVLASGGKEEINREIEERIYDTISHENQKLQNELYEKYGFFKRFAVYQRKKMKNNLTVVVRNGDVFSAKQLKDISLDRAKSVVILGNETNNTDDRSEQDGNTEERGQGNTQTIKALMQVSDITAAENSADNQKIIVEISDNRTWEIVQRIIAFKQVKGKCNIVPVRVNNVLGQILSQFSLMPELNLAYTELFSNKGVTFYVEERKVDDDKEYISRYLDSHSSAIPLTSMKADDNDYFYYTAEREKDISRSSDEKEREFTVKLNRERRLEKKNVIILGHNSNCHGIMQGFASFRNEWNYKDGDEILQVIVIDDAENLKKMNNYEEYSFVRTVAAGLYDRDIICATIDEVLGSNEEDTSILILSDDSVQSEDIDSVAFTNLAYVQDIIARKSKETPDFDIERIDVVVEIIDPKHHDVVKSYSFKDSGEGKYLANNIIISNRYISKMITQIGEKEAIFDFYKDILAYDAGKTGEFTGKEIYTKKASAFFDELPGECTESEFVNAVWKASIDESLPPEKRYPTIALGYVKPGGNITLFGRNRSNKKMKLDARDKVIVFTNH